MTLVMAACSRAPLAGDEGSDTGGDDGNDDGGWSSSGDGSSGGSSSGGSSSGGSSSGDGSTEDPGDDGSSTGGGDTSDPGDTTWTGTGTASTEPDRAPIVEDCDDVLAESHVCATIADVTPQVLENDRYVMLVGMDTGTVCPLTPIIGAEEYPLWGHSLVWHDDYVYTCDVLMLRIALADGSVEASEGQCEAVSGDGETTDLLVLEATGDEQIRRYPSWDAFVGGGPLYVHALDLVGSYSRLHVDVTEVYMSWHSTDTVDVYDLDEGWLLRSLALEGYEGWIDGMAVLEHQTLVLLDRSVDRVALLDAHTGASLGSLWPNEALYKLSGLACR